MAFQEIVPGVYELGREVNRVVADGNGFTSTVLNTRDLGNPGEPEFVLLGPGSSVWFLSYAIHIDAPAAAPTDPAGFVLDVNGSFDTAIPFQFFRAESIALGVYEPAPAPGVNYQGKARMDWPAAQLSLVNLTGESLTVTYQFWGKPF